MSEDRFPYASREWAQPIEVRDIADGGRTIYGRVIPYGEVATVDDGAGPYRESFAPGAFSRSIEQAGNKVRMYEQHNRTRLPIGIATEWDDKPDGLHGAFRLSSPAGDGALNLVLDGVVDSFSVGFSGIQARNEAGVTVRTEAALREVSLVATPAYSGAVIAGVRAADIAALDEDEVREWIESLDPATRALIEQIAAPAAGTGDTPDTGPAEGTATRQLNLQRARLALAQI